MDGPVYKQEYNNSWALIIGINEYKHAGQLSYAKNDAEAIANIIESKFKFPKANIIKLLDETATRNEIMKSYLRYTKCDVSPDDRLLVFFAMAAQ